MSLLTEAELRLQLRAEDLDALEEYKVEAGTIVTPSARAFLSDHRINLIIGDKRISSAPKIAQGAPSKNDTRTLAQPDETKSNLPEFAAPQRYTTATGAYYDEKPEHMTSIRGTKLVNKDHPVIAFRGKIDSLEARILEVQLALHKLGLDGAVKDLGEILQYTQELLRCEVLERELGDMLLLGMDSDEIRSRSHTPKKYYGMNHFAAGLEHGEPVILLNTLRTQVREVELAAYDAFKDDCGVPQRTDIIKGLNRLSSLFYVMMFRVLAGEYAL